MTRKLIEINGIKHEMKIENGQHILNVIPFEKTNEYKQLFNSVQNIIETIHGRLSKVINNITERYQSMTDDEKREFWRKVAEEMKEERQ